MSEEFDDIIKQSYVKLRKKKMAAFLWQKKWVVLKRACSKGPRRLEVFQDEQACMVGSIPKTFDLCAIKLIRRIQGDIRKHAIEVTCNDDTILAFSSDSEVNTKEWMSALQTDDGLDPVTQQNSDIFNVYLLPSSILSDFGECLLQVTEDQIRLLRLSNIREEIASWPLIALRRYGRDESKFTFECGRKCETGEGIFVLNTKVGSDIYHKVHSATQAIATTYHLMHTQQVDEEFNGNKTRAPPLEQKSVSSLTLLVAPMPDRSPTDGGDIAARAPHPLPRPTPAEIGKVYTSVRSSTNRRLPPTPDSFEYQPLAEENSVGMSYTTPEDRRGAVGPNPTIPRANGYSGPKMNGFPGRVPSSPNGYQGGGMSPSPSAYTDRSAMPLPAVPGTLPVTPPAPRLLEEIYEESGLNEEFRRFLASRKDAPL